MIWVYTCDECCATRSVPRINQGKKPRRWNVGCKYASKQPIRISPVLSPVTVGADDLCALTGEEFPSGFLAGNRQTLSKPRLPEHKDTLAPEL